MTPRSTTVDMRRRGAGRVLLAHLFVLAILGVAAFGYWQGTPDDLVEAVRAGDVERVRKALRRDPQAVHTRSYSQAHERASERKAYEIRHGQSPWQGRTLIHDAVQRIIDPLPMLDVLAASGADLAVRLNGRTLLHLAARQGNLEAAAWLIGRGADVNAKNDCSPACAELGQTPLHDGLAFKDDGMTELLLSRGAAVNATAANGQSALHQAAATGKLGGAFVLCRHGAEPDRVDGAGKTPADRAGELAQGLQTQAPEEGLQHLVRWLQPRSGCAVVAAAARATGSPVPEAQARKVFAETVLR